MNAPLAIPRSATLLVAALFFAGCNNRDPEQSTLARDLPKVSVRVRTAQPKPHPATEEIMGTVQAKLRATLEAKVSGRITAMPVVQGQAVESGQTLAQLDVDEIKARLAQARAQQELAQRDLQRLTALVAQDAATRQDLDAAQTKALVTQAALDEATTMLHYAEIKAPFAGVITRKLADVGDLASPGKPLLEMEDPDALRLEAGLPEALIGRVRQGDHLAVQLPAIDARIDATVAEIAPGADPLTRTVLLKLDLPAHPGLRTGLFGRVAVPLKERTALLVPIEAVVRRGQMEIVFVALEDRAQLRLVKTGRRSGDEIELLSGVAAGERVVVENADRLRDRQPLEVRP